MSAIVTDRDVFQTAVSPKKRHWSVPLMRNPRFVGRGQQIKELEAIIFSNGYFRKVAIFGLGGAGKTQLALEMAYRVRDQDPECSVFWISATNVEHVRQALLGIAHELGISGLDDPDADVIALVKQCLSDENFGQWLLILDSLDEIDMKKGQTNPALSTRFVDDLPSSSKGSILMTTRNRKHAFDFARNNVLQIPQDDKEIALEILKGTLYEPSMVEDDLPSAMELLKRLTYLPLATVQAAMYMDKNDISIAEYLSLWDDTEETAIELLSEDFDEEWRYKELKNPVATTWLISFEKIRRSDPFAAEILSFIACLEPTMIPLTLLISAPTKKKLLDALGTLVAYSFITKEARGRFLNVHRLVHLATRSWIRDQGILDKWAQRAMQRLVEEILFNKPDRSVWRTYLQHAKFALAADPMGFPTMERMLLLHGYGACLSQDGWYVGAEQLLTEASEISRKIFGDKHLLTLVGQAKAAQPLLSQGRFAEGEKVRLSLLKTQQEALGKHHPVTLMTLCDLGTALQGQGRFEKAEEIYRQVIDVSSKVLGPSHIETLTAINNLALAQISQGKEKEAEEWQRKALKELQETQGSDHSMTLVLANNLGYNLSSQRKYEEAERLHRETLETRQRLFGEEHPDTIHSLLNLAQTLHRQGKTEKSEEMHRDILEKAKRVLGENHPLVITSLSNLACAVSSVGKIEEAEELHRLTAGKAKEVLGAGHLDTLQYSNAWAEMLIEKGRHAEAKDILQEALEMLATAWKSELDLQWPVDLLSSGDIGEGDRWPAKGVEMEIDLSPLSDYLAQISKSTGPQKPSSPSPRNDHKDVHDMDIVKSKGSTKENSPSMDSANTAQSSQTETIYRQKISEQEICHLAPTAAFFGISEELLTKGGRVALQAASNLALSLTILGRSGEGEALDRIIVKVKENVLGKEDPSTIATMVHLAEAIFLNGGIDESEKLQRDLLEICDRTMLNDVKPKLAITNQLTTALQFQGKLNEAEDMQHRALKMAETLDQANPLRLSCDYNHAELLRYQGKLDEAAGIHEKVLGERQKLLGDSRIETLLSLLALAKIFGGQGRYGAAELILRVMVEKSEKVLGREQWLTRGALTLLAAFLPHLGKLEESENIAREVLPLNERAYGMDGTETVATVSMLATVLARQGKYTECKELLHRALVANERLSGEFHENTTTILVDLMESALSQGSFEDAEAPCRRLVEIKSHVEGKEHPDTLAMLSILGEIVQNQGKFQEAEGIGQQVLEGRTKVLGEDHVDTLISSNNVAVAQRFQGRHRDAEILYEETIAKAEKALGVYHPMMLRCLENLTELFMFRERWNEAENTSRRILEVSENALSIDNIERTIQALVFLAQALQHQGKYIEAEEVSIRAVDKCQQTAGSDHFVTMSCRNRLGVILLERGEYGRAEVISREVLDRSKKVLGEVNGIAVAATCNLAGIFKCQGRNSEAEETIRLAFEGAKSIPGANGEELVQMCEGLLGEILHAKSQ